MATLKRQRTNGEWEYVQVVGSDTISAFDTHLADYVRQPAFAATTGTSTAYTVTLNPVPISIVDGFGITIVPHIDSGATPTLNINGLGAIALKTQSGEAMTMLANTPYSFKKVGTDFLADSSGGLDDFFGDGSDGAFNPDLNAMTTAPNGGTVANLWNGGVSGYFTTGTLSSTSDQVVFQIDFGSPTAINSTNGTLYPLNLYNVIISTGSARTLNLEWSNDGLTWTVLGGSNPTATTSYGDKTFGSGGGYEASRVARYIRLVLKAGGSSCTLSIQGAVLNWMTGDIFTNKIWNIIIPVTPQSGVAVKQYSSFNLPAKYTISTDNPCRGLMLYSQGNTTVNGTIDMSQKAGLAPNGETIPMVITKRAYKTATTSSLLHFDSNLTDAQGRTWTNNTSTFDTTNKMFGVAALSLNSSPSWIDTPMSDDFSFGNEDFTIDFWRRGRNNGTNNYIFSTQDSNSSYGSIDLIKTSSEKLQLNIWKPGDKIVPSIIVYGKTSITTLSWYHVEIDRCGDYLYVFLNGNLEILTFVGNISIQRCMSKFTIGRQGSTASAYDYATIDEFRVIKGKAMHTSNFIPPTSAYTYTATYIDTPKTLEKYYQLTTVLQNLKGGYGGNGGYGGGNAGATGRQTSVGIGGAGRQNLGGFGGGGSGGNGNSGVGGIGGSIEYAELGGGRLNVTSLYTTSINGTNGSSGGPGTNSASPGISPGGRCNGGGVGGFGGYNGSAPVSPSDAQYAGGFICIITKGNFTIGATGILKCNGGNGSSGTNGAGTSAGGGGGGAGSGGGAVALFTKGVYTNNGTIQVNAGLGGSGGTGNSPGESGGSGTSGSVGTILIQQL